MAMDIWKTLHNVPSSPATDPLQAMKREKNVHEKRFMVIDHKSHQRCNANSINGPHFHYKPGFHMDRFPFPSFRTDVRVPVSAVLFVRDHTTVGCVLHGLTFIGQA
jgi:hypothetical protein